MLTEPAAAYTELEGSTVPFALRTHGKLWGKDDELPPVINGTRGERVEVTVTVVDAEAPAGDVASSVKV